MKKIAVLLTIVYGILTSCDPYYDEFYPYKYVYWRPGQPYTPYRYGTLQHELVTYDCNNHSYSIIVESRYCPAVCYNPYLRIFEVYDGDTKIMESVNDVCVRHIMH